jgi:hypothetical protein
MPIEGYTSTTLKTEVYIRLKKSAEKQKRSLSQALDVLLDMWDKKGGENNNE